MINAENGCPIICSQFLTLLGIVPSSNKGLFKTVLPTIKTIGIPIIANINPTAG